MAKVSRSVLKEIVKECLVEILSEGLHSNTEEIYENRKRPKGQKSRKRQSGIAPEVFQQRNKMLREKTERQPKVDVSNITSDPLMQELLADTASTTFRDQPLSESSGHKKDYTPGDAAAKVVYENDLGDLFEGAGKWASLAFSDAKN